MFLSPVEAFRRTPLTYCTIGDGNEILLSMLASDILPPTIPYRRFRLTADRSINTLPGPISGTLRCVACVFYACLWRTSHQAQVRIPSTHRTLLDRKALVGKRRYNNTHNVFAMTFSISSGFQTLMIRVHGPQADATFERSVSIEDTAQDSFQLLRNGLWRWVPLLAWGDEANVINVMVGISVKQTKRER